jgi:hypothetical protein
MANVVPVGDTITLNFLITSAGAGVVSQTPYVVLQRLSDSAYWTGTGFSNTYSSVALAQVDSVNQPGLYSVVFNQSLYDSGEDSFRAYYVNTGIHATLAVEEYIFSFINAASNPTLIANVVKSVLFTDVTKQINVADIASQTTLLATQTTVNTINSNMAQASVLDSFITSATTSLSSILTAVTPLIGSNQITFTALDQNSLPIPDVQITVKNTTSQITLAVANTGINGNAVLGLPAGVFNVLYYKAFYTFGTQPYALTVTTDQAVAISGVSFQPTAPTVSGCAAYLYIIDATGQPAVGINFRAKAVSNYPYTAGSSTLVTKNFIENNSDNSGFIQLNLIQGMTYELNCPSLYLTVTDWVCPAVVSLDISTLLSVNS